MATRPSITTIVLGGEDDKTTGSFCTGLSKELTSRDNVIVVAPTGSRTKVTWRKLKGGSLRPTGTGCHPGEIVVIVDGRVTAGRGWLGSLVSAFADPGVAAAAPRSNDADGEELLVGIPYRPNETAGRRIACTVALGEVTPVTATRLGGPCLAIRRNLLEATGGFEAVLRGDFDPGAISLAVAAMGSLVVTEGVYLHHPGGPPRRADPKGSGQPFVSACLIVRNEEENLERSLGSLVGFADEIIVYDTGSTDGTIALAQSLGATVIEGYWDDDFARARNDALAFCRGQWICWIDADEALLPESIEELRGLLRASSAMVEGYLVTIDNLRGNEAATVLSHPACRLFRRAVGRWEGRIHEQIVARAGSPALALPPISGVRIAHWGYVQELLAGRSKGERNLRGAFGDLAGGSELGVGERLTSLARSYLLAGRLNEGLDLARVAVTKSTNPSTRRFARRALIEGLLAGGKPEEVLREVELLRGELRFPMLADAHEGHALAALGRYEEALSAFDRVIDGVDDDGFEYKHTFVSCERAESLAALGRPSEAADALLESLRLSGGLDAHLGLLVQSLEEAHRPLDELVRGIPGDRVRAFVPQIIQLEAGVADRVLEAWHLAIPQEQSVLAAAASVAVRLPLERQLVWSQRLRFVGLTSACPLIAATTDGNVPLATRALAAAASWAAFHDLRGCLAFTALLGATAGMARQELIEAAAVLAPDLIAANSSDHDDVRQETSLSIDGTKSDGTVIVVSRDAVDLEALSLAFVLRTEGHDVILIQPQPAASAEELLGPHHVRVLGWHEGKSWTNDCERLVASLYASEPIDAVVTVTGARAVTGRLRELLPLASFHEARALVRPADLHGLFPAVTVPESERFGCALLGSLRGDDLSMLAQVERLAAAGLPPDLPMVHLGDDPERRVRRLIPDVIEAGPLADPRHWIAAARFAIVPTASLEGTWGALARSHGTPTICLERLSDLDLGALGNPSPAPPRLPTTEAFSPSEGGPRLSLLRERTSVMAKPFDASSPVRVELRGSIDGAASLSIVNRELVSRLGADDRFAIAVSRLEEPTRNAVDVRCDVEIRHQWPPDFSPRRAQHLVVIQPWEFGGYPAEWIGPLRDVADELWVPSSWNRRCAIASGLDPERVRVVPNGVDVDMFKPSGERYPLQTDKRNRLLYVGGLIERKGIDALFESYFASFTRDDDVCLVVKGFGSNSVYRNSTLEPVVRRFAEGDGPEIELITDEISRSEMASLFRAADVLVHPYRGEGFGMPIAEAMASGLPVIVTDGGASLDFCDEEVGWLVAAEQIPISPAEWTPSKGGAYWFEPSRERLARALVAAVADPDARRTRGDAARRRIVEGFTWEHAVEIATQNLLALAGRSLVSNDLLEMSA